MGEKIGKYWMFSVGLLMILCGCVDEIPIDNYIIGEGEAEISAVVEFNPLVATLDNNSRGAAGNAIKNIRELSVVIYDSNKKLYKIYNTGDLKNLALVINQEGNTQMPPDVDGSKQAEAKTAKATFKLPALPFGKYYMYAVANVGDVTEEMAETPEKLKSYRAEWQSDAVSKNDQMFGYFTTMSNQESGFFDAPPFIVNKKNVEAHSWIKRLASKVTLVYDGSGLHEGIFIYIHSVQIKDIPRTCLLGEDNTPAGDGSAASVEEQLIADGDYIYYNEKGEVLDKDLYPNLSDYKDHWLEINKSVVAGAVEKDEKGVLKYGPDGKPICHGENETALYFYENMQGNYKDAPNKEFYNKEPNPKDVWTDQSQGHEGYKDNVPYGTYIEVDGYYLSINPSNQSYGKIKYRFMLGKDTKYDYNAQRNHHYKLTLKFRGYANQPEWHIEYEEDEPGLYPPELFYMPYLYNRRQELPVRFTGRPVKLVAQIIENNWAPYDPEYADSVPPDYVAASAGMPANMAFKWYRKVYETIDGGVEWLYGRHGKSFYDNLGLTYDPDINYKKGGVTPIWVGFLGLRVPAAYNDESKRLPTGYYNTPGSNFYDRKTSVEGLRNDYINDSIYRKEYIINYNSLTSGAPTQVGTGRNSYKLQLNNDNSVTAIIPMFTQPKALIYISGFSGGNPYEAYRRKAVVRFTAYYEGGETISKNVPVYQVRRVVNPKGIWRRWNNTDPFTVTLSHQESAASGKFVPVESYGEWMAYISKENSTSDEPGTSSFITLSGGSRVENGVVYGSTGSDVSFTVNFSGVAENDCDCARIVVRYHGFSCEHTILVRQGYYKAISIANSTPNALWSSFNVFKFNDGDYMQSKGELNCEMTVSPLAMGTLFKRGNYTQGIRIINNNDYGPLVNLNGASLQLTDGTGKKWDEINGVPFKRQVALITGKTEANTTWEWAKFKATVDGKVRHYRFPTYDEYNALVTEADFGYGVLYADGASKTADNVETAFKFYNVGNTVEMSSSEFGMRGVFVYNPNNFNNIFFPVGAFGIGRRTIQNTTAAEKGYLRYGAVNNVLSKENNTITIGGNTNGVIPGQYSNTYRPICYNLPASPGALYWIAKPNGDYVGWDMNYFDMSFNGQDYGASFYPDGDAFPIKPIYVSTDN